jgi:polyisoprenoid-binding protein YceI
MKNTSRYFAIISLILLPVIMTYAQTTWVPDKAHSSVRFTVAHLVIAEVEGSFRNFYGTATSSKPDFSDLQVDFTVDVTSITTDNEMRDNHLKSDDFFNAGKFPKMTFKSRSIKKVSDNKYELMGDLTIRDVTRFVKFDVLYNGTVKDGYGNTKAGFKATATINRFDYSLKWNTLTETGGTVVGKDVGIVINLELTPQK